MSPLIRAAVKSTSRKSRGIVVTEIAGDDNVSETRVQDKFVSFTLPDPNHFNNIHVENTHHKTTRCHFRGVVVQASNGRKVKNTMRSVNTEDIKYSALKRISEFHSLTANCLNYKSCSMNLA